jgi:hypothetical protein
MLERKNDETRTFVGCEVLIALILDLCERGTTKAQQLGNAAKNSATKRSGAP